MSAQKCLFGSFAMLLLAACSSSSSPASPPPTDASTATDSPTESSSQDSSPPEDAPNDSTAEASSFDAGPLTNGVSTLAGSSAKGLVDGPRDLALFNNPANTLYGPDGQVYVADFDNGAIRRVTAEGVVSTLFSSKTFYRPFGLAFGTDAMLYVQTDGNDTGGNDATTGTIWRINPQSGAAEVLLRNIGRPRGLARLADNRFVLTDIKRDDLRILDPINPAALTLAGSNGQPGYVDGPGADARFNAPYDAVVLPNATIIVSDKNNHRLRSVKLDGTVATFAGTGEIGSKDGDALSATFDGPQGLALDNQGNIYVSDSRAFVIRRIDKDGKVTTLAGTGTASFADNENPLSAAFYGLEGLDCSPDGLFLYVADGTRGEEGPYHRIRRVRQ